MEPQSNESAPQSSTSAIVTTSSPDRKRARWILWSFLFLITAIVSGTLGAVAVLTPPLATALSPQQDDQLSLKDIMRQTLRYEVTRPVTVLVMGVDRVLDAAPNSPQVLAGRSDTMLLLRVDPQNNTVNLLSIPRDTRVEIPGEGMTKINSANEIGGSGLAARVVSHTLNGVPIDRYVRVSTDSFRELVDLLGGVEVYVPRKMKYDDNTQDLHIDLDQGWQTLNGKQAEGFARFRADGNGDIGRVQRQQTLIRALRERLTSPAVLPRLPQAIELMQKYVDTNLSLEEMLALVSFGLNLDREDFHMVMLPGRFSTADEYVASYWLMDEAGRDQVMASYFGMPMVGMMQDRQSLRQLRIAVQNASDEPDAGQRAAAYLQSQGFNNVYVIEDWPDKQQQTQIIAQRGDLDSAQRLETTLGLGEVVAASTGDLNSDITLRVGTDWLDRIDG